jgi:hypothetical protein
MLWKKLESYGWPRVAFAIALLFIILSLVLTPFIRELLGMPVVTPRSSRPDSDIITYSMWFLGVLSLALFSMFLFLLIVSLYSEVEERRARASAMGGTILNWFLATGTGAAGLIGFTLL